MSIEAEVKAEVAKVEGEVVAEVKKVEGEVVAKEKAAVVKLKAEEELFLASAELDFLKAQTEIQRITKIAEEKSKSYQAYVENLFKLYVLDRSEYIFDGAVRIFKKL